MDKTHPPLAFGVFNPVGHTVIAYRSAVDMQAAVSALVEHGFAYSSLVLYTPQEMKAQVDSELRIASPLAAFGHELDLIKGHRALAESGCSFLFVHAPQNRQAEYVAAVARATKAVAAHHYGTFMIEELTEQTPGDAPAS
ncbi:MAG: hypothetical protein Q7K57_18050 [Burkholderiaceae bacterium]|nr:hypothetical protein [Burkholderiaceae bacterium]